MKTKLQSNIGNLVEIHWIDACGYHTRPEEGTTCPKAVNLGILRALFKKEGLQCIRLQTGIYTEDPPKNPDGDWVCIPVGCVYKVETVRKKK